MKMNEGRETIRKLYRGVPGSVVIRMLTVPFILSMIDLTVTLLFQPSAYWSGDRSSVVEGNPVARLALRHHPLLLIPGFVAWYALLWPLIFKTPAWIGLRIQIFVVSGHLVMIGGWLIRNHHEGLIIFAFIAAISSMAAFWSIRPFLCFWNSEQSLQAKIFKSRQ